MTTDCKNVTLLAGGVGGAKLAEGLATLDNINLSIIGNIADDDEFHGLWVSPDIDTMIYTLAGLVNRDQGWGLANDDTKALQILNTLGCQTWMSLGDKDFGLHIYRSERLRRGERPFDITVDIARHLGVKSSIILPTDNRVQTRVKTINGWISFQEYFVRETCNLEVIELAYEGIETARPAPEALEAIDQADIIIIAPSNPLVSIAPILQIPGIKKAIEDATAPTIALSPLIGGKAVKGPADKMLKSLGMEANVLGIARFYAELVDLLLIDPVDQNYCSHIEDIGIKAVCRNIMMNNLDDKTSLSKEVLALGLDLKLEKGT